MASRPERSGMTPSPHVHKCCSFRSQQAPQGHPRSHFSFRRRHESQLCALVRFRGGGTLDATVWLDTSPGAMLEDRSDTRAWFRAGISTCIRGSGSREGTAGALHPGGVILDAMRECETRRVAAQRDITCSRPALVRARTADRFACHCGAWTCARIQRRGESEIQRPRTRADGIRGAMIAIDLEDIVRLIAAGGAMDRRDTVPRRRVPWTSV